MIFIMINRNLTSLFRAARYLNRMSWATTTSSSTAIPSEYLDGIDVYDDMPATPTNASKSFRPRDSMCSIATFMTDCSADAIIPRDELPQAAGRSKRPTTLRMEMDFWQRQSISFDSPDLDGEFGDDEDDENDEFIGAFFQGMLCSRYPSNEPTLTFDFFQMTALDLLLL